MQGSVYLITCRASKKKYVGITKSCISKRWRGHVSQALRKISTRPLHVAIRQFGEEVFSVKILESGFSTRKALYAAEKRYIEQHKTLWPKGYNIVSSVGDGDYGPAFRDLMQKENYLGL